ncbi:unnamed protein product [Closterium sp. NIES-65]|nr:unnamed protein product [Closterium sp. NIES-65]
MARSPLASSLVTALLVTALFASCAQARLVSYGLLGNRIPNRPGQVTCTITSTVSDLNSALQAQVVSLEGTLTQSLDKLATAGSSYAVAYELVATGMAEAPQAAAIYSGNSTCGQAAPPVALQLPGTWQLLSSVSWSLASVLTVAPADLAPVLSAIQAGANGQLSIGFASTSSSLSGKLIGGRL